VHSRIFSKVWLSNSVGGLWGDRNPQHTAASIFRKKMVLFYPRMASNENRLSRKKHGYTRSQHFRLVGSVRVETITVSRVVPTLISHWSSSSVLFVLLLNITDYLSAVFCRLLCWWRVCQCTWIVITLFFLPVRSHLSQLDPVISPGHFPRGLPRVTT